MLVDENDDVLIVPLPRMASSLLTPVRGRGHKKRQGIHDSLCHSRKSFQSANLQLLLKSFKYKINDKEIFSQQ